MNRPSRVIGVVVLAVAALGGTSIGAAVGQRIDRAAEVASPALRVDPPVLDRLTPEQRAAYDLAAAINAERQRRGLPDLLWNDQIAAAAFEHSVDMAARKQLDHTGADGSDAGQRLRAAGFNWLDWGEAIASGYLDPETLVQAWMASAAHRVFLIGDYRYLGTGARAADDGRPFWTLVVGT